VSSRKPFQWTTSSPSSIPGDHLFDATPELRRFRRNLNYLTTALETALPQVRWYERHCDVTDLREVSEMRAGMERQLESVRELHQAFIELLVEASRTRRRA
jgi:hypothetical protein